MTATDMSHQLHTRRILVLISLAVLSESLSSTILFPFVYFMVRDFNIDNDERLIGSRAGLITSSFYLAQMCTTTIWGSLSDKYGRRYILMLGLLGNTVSIIFFGTSRSLVFAILSRSVCGFLNGNIAVARTSVGELAVQQKLDQAKVFSLFGFCSALGFIVGPLIGGLLANPASTIGFTGPYDLFLVYPYLLPCLVGAVVSGTTLVMSFFMMEETNEAVRNRSKPADSVVQATENQPLLSDPGSNGACNVVPNTEIPIKPVTPKSRIEPAAFWCIFGASFMCFHSIIYDELFPLFAAANTENDIGLGYSAAQIASTISLMGVVIFLAQLVWYPLLNKYFSTLTLWRFATLFFILVYPFFPIVPRLLNAGVGIQRSVLLVLMTCRFTMIVIAYTSINILMNNSTDPASKGLVNGIAQSSASLGRAIGPALGGVIWSWSLSNGLAFPLNHYFLFILISLFAVVQLVGSLYIPGRISTIRRA